MRKRPEWWSVAAFESHAGEPEFVKLGAKKNCHTTILE